MSRPVHDDHCEARRITSMDQFWRDCGCKARAEQAAADSQTS